MNCIGIIGAMEEEVAKLKEEVRNLTITEKAGMEFYQGLLLGKKVVVVRSGIGKVNAGMCTQILADLFQVDAVINTGIAGSLKDEIDIGDIVISTDVLQRDVDVRYFGYELGEIPRMNRLSFPADENLCEICAQASRRVNQDVQVFKGRVVSGDQFVGDKKHKKEISDLFGGYCTEMEGAAIGQAAWLNNIPFVIIRAVSDKADDSAVEDYSVFEGKAIKHSVNLVMEVLKSL